MTAGFTAILFSAGVAAWIYSKTSHRTNDVQTSVTVAGVVGVIAFIVFFTVLKVILKV